jgi:hypothetical protein
MLSPSMQEEGCKSWKWISRATSGKNTQGQSLVIRYTILYPKINRKKSNRSSGKLVVVYPTLCLRSRAYMRECHLSIGGIYPQHLFDNTGIPTEDEHLQ